MILLMMRMTLSLKKVMSDLRANLHIKKTLKKLKKNNKNYKWRLKDNKNNNQSKLINKKKVELSIEIKIKLSNFMKMILKIAQVKKKKNLKL